MLNRKERVIYTLYWDRGGANMAAHAVLEELGVAYQLVEVDLSKGQQRSAEYLAINPNGKVPTLIHQDKAIYESSGILMYLLDQHPEAELAPSTLSPLRGSYYQYLIWMSNTLQETANRWAHPESYVDSHEAKKQMVRAAVKELSRCWQLLDDELGNNGPWILGDKLSGADFHLFMIAYWSRRYDSRAQDFPHIRRHIEAMLRRESVQRMMLQEDLKFLV